MNNNKIEFLTIDVLTASKRRIADIINSFDHVAVAFSGGKDSLVCINLVEEVYRDLGKKEKVNVLFRDEELIPEDVIEFVQSIYKSGRFNFKYFAYPTVSEKYILGKKESYIQWDPNRKHIRPMPNFAITDKTKAISQYMQDDLIAESFGFRGRTCFITGIRSAESLTRFAAIVAKRNKPYIAGTKSKHVFLGRPIYDWSEKDIFRYMYERKIQYCEIYDNQVFNRQALRVATPLIADSSKRIGQLKTLYPKFYNQLVDLFPEVEVQARYFNELDRYGIMDRYEHSFKGIIMYINDNLTDPEIKAVALSRVRSCALNRANKIKGGATNLGGYPVLHVFKAIVNGSYRRQIQPKSVPSAQELEFEGISYKK